MSEEEVKKKKKRRRKRKKKKTIIIDQQENIQNPICYHCEHNKNYDHKCTCKECHDCNCDICEHKDECKKYQYEHYVHTKEQIPQETYCKYDFMKLDTLEEKAIFCKCIYEDIIDCYDNLSHNKIKETMKTINKYFLYDDEDGNTLLNLELLGILKEISGYEVKPVWEKVTSGVGINLHIGLAYKNIVFSLCKDFENV